MAALDMTMRGAPEGAIRILRQLLMAPVSGAIAASAWNNIGMAYSFLGEMVKAHECYAMACQADESRLEPWLNRVVQGIQLGMTKDACESGKMIDRFPSSHHCIVNMFSAAKRRQQENGEWQPSQSSRSVIRLLETSCGPAMRRMISVFE
jgi:hypothetical protein